MPSDHLINHYARCLISAARAKNFSPDAVSAILGLDTATVQDPESSYTSRHLSRLTWGLMSAMDDEFFGLTRSRCRPGTFGFIAESMLRCQTLGEALDHCCRYYSLVNDDVLLRLQRSEGRVSLVIQLKEPELDCDGLLKEWLVSKWYRFSSWLIDECIPLTEIHFTHGACVDESAYMEVFNCRCQFNSYRVSLQFPEQYLYREIHRDKSELGQLLEGVRRSMDIVTASGSILSIRLKLKQLLKESLRTEQGFPSIEMVAEGLNFSSQTVRRRLRQEGVTYRELKEDVWQELVLEYLDDAHLSLHEVASITGYAEPAGLSRAVKSWFGVSPSEYRRQRDLKERESLVTSL